MSLTTNEILDLMVQILGQSVDNATGWKTTGSQSGRNALSPDIEERMITRILNDFNGKFATLNQSVDGFVTRFSMVAGDNFTVDKETFESIGSNLIQAVAALQQQVSTNPGYTPTETEQAVLDSGITAEILGQIIEALRVDGEGEEGVINLISVSQEITEIKGDIQNLQETKMDADAIRPMTNQEIDEVFDTVFGEGEEEP